MNVRVKLICILNHFNTHSLIYILCYLYLPFTFSFIRLTIMHCTKDYSYLNLMFIGPCIIIYSYSTPNKMRLFLKLFILVKPSACFRHSFRPSSGAQNWTYGNRHMSN